MTETHWANGGHGEITPPTSEERVVRGMISLDAVEKSRSYYLRDGCKPEDKI